MIRNFIPSASMMKPKATFTELSQPPDFGSLLIHEGKKANNVKGNAKANENPNMPTTGLITSPVAASTNNPPTRGAVHEKDTNTSVSAMKKEPIYPPLSACLSDLLTIHDGKTISNIPKKEAAKIVNSVKNKIFGSQCVLSQLIKP